MSRIVAIPKGMILIFLMFFAFACSASKSVIMNQGQEIRPNLPFEIGLMSDHKDNTYQIGEDIHLFFATNRDCYMTLINISSDCKVKVLLPNPIQKDNLAKVGFIYRIPSESAKFKFKAGKQVGEEVVKAIATLDDIQLFDPKILKGEGSIQEIVMCKDIFEKELSTKLNSLSPGKWTEYQMKLKIVNLKP